jgi:hypothetical protein
VIVVHGITLLDVCTLGCSHTWMVTPLEDKYGTIPMYTVVEGL